MKVALSLIGYVSILAGIVVMLTTVSAMRTLLLASGTSNQYSGFILLPNVSAPVLRAFRVANPQHSLLKRLPLATGLIVLGGALAIGSDIFSGIQKA